MVRTWFVITALLEWSMTLCFGVSWVFSLLKIITAFSCDCCWMKIDEIGTILQYMFETRFGNVQVVCLMTLLIEYHETTLILTEKCANSTLSLSLLWQWTSEAQTLWPLYHKEDLMWKSPLWCNLRISVSVHERWRKGLWRILSNHNIDQM